MAAALYARLPESIWGTVSVMILVGITCMGYRAGLAGVRNWLASSVVIASFAIVTTMIADLDRPSDEWIKVNQMPMIDLAKKIGAGTDAN